MVACWPTDPPGIDHSRVGSKPFSNAAARRATAADHLRRCWKAPFMCAACGEFCCCCACDVGTRCVSQYSSTSSNLNKRYHRCRVPADTTMYVSFCCTPGAALPRGAAAAPPSADGDAARGPCREGESRSRDPEQAAPTPLPASSKPCVGAPPELANLTHMLCSWRDDGANAAQDFATYAYAYIRHQRVGVA